MKIWQMHSFISQICKSNQIKRNYKRTSATTATKQVCWPHSHKPQEDSWQTSLLVKYRTFRGKTCGNQGVFGLCFGYLLFPSQFAVSECLSLQCSFLHLPQEQCPAGGSLQAAGLCPFQRHSCWMSAAPKLQKSPTQRHILNCQASSQWEHHGVKYSAAIWHFYSPVLNFWALIDQPMREKE